jgi:peptide/nickel transport system substrate-binding protein
MNGRSGVITLLFFVLLAIVILLQIFSMMQSDRFYEGLNRLDDILKGGIPIAGDKNVPKASSADEEYPGYEGDWLIWSFRVEPKTLNPISADTDTYAIWITIPYIFEPLLTYDFDTVTLKPFLAESYEISFDGLQLTFHLRDDICFSDGVPVTADDVIFTYETIINPKVDAANVASQYVDVQSVLKVDDKTVSFIMKKPYFKSLENLSFTWSMGIFPKHIYQFTDAGEFNKRRSRPVGSGPYVFEKWDVGREIVFARNENYWGTKPKIKKRIFKFITNAVAAVQAIRSGEVDMIIPEPDQYADLVADETFKNQFNCLAYYTPDTPFFYIGWNEDTPFFSDRNVRLAMTYMINRRQIVDELLKGYGKIVTGPFYIFGPLNDPNVQPWPYDLEYAKKLLDEAGWVDTDGDGIRDKNGIVFRFKFMYSSENALYQRILKFLKDSCAKVGIDIIPEPLEWSILINRLNDRKFDSTIMGWGGEILEDPYQIFHSSQIGNRASNFVGFRNPEADALIEEIRRTFDDQKRTLIFQKLHRLLHDQQPYTFLFTRPTFRILDKRFQNVIIHKLGLNYLEWYVPKELQKYK